MLESARCTQTCEIIGGTALVPSCQPEDMCWTVRPGSCELRLNMAQSHVQLTDTDMNLGPYPWSFLDLAPVVFKIIQKRKNIH